MPTYDYRCKACQYTFEKLVPLADRDQVECPKCGTKSVERLLTGGNYLKTQGCYTNQSCGGGCGCGS